MQSQSGWHARRVWITLAVAALAAGPSAAAKEIGRTSHHQAWVSAVQVDAQGDAIPGAEEQLDDHSSSAQRWLSESEAAAGVHQRLMPESGHNVAIQDVKGVAFGLAELDSVTAHEQTARPSNKSEPTNRSSTSARKKGHLGGSLIQEALRGLPWIRREVASSFRYSATAEIIWAVLAFIVFSVVMYWYLSQPVAFPKANATKAGASATAFPTVTRRKSSAAAIDAPPEKEFPRRSMLASDVWPKMPAPEALLAVGPTYHINMRNSLSESLARRGMRAARKDTTALVAMYGGRGPDRQRALLEMCFRDALSNKRTLALHLQSAGLTALAPLTLLSPAALRARLGGPTPRGGPEIAGETSGGAPPAAWPQRQVLAKEVQDGLWFLKHSAADNNTNVTCFLGAEALLKHWETKIAREERIKYVAQAEVAHPLLHEGPSSVKPAQGTEASSSLSATPSLQTGGRKVTIRAYIVLLEGGRCFLHRELLLKVHSEPYAADNPSLEQHVFCHCTHEGVGTQRGSHWSQYNAIWPRLCEMMGATFGGFDHGIMQSRKLEIDSDYGIPETWQSLVFGREPVDAVQYTILGVDLLVDKNLQPWLIELNVSPSLAPERKDPVGTRIKAEVLEDFCKLVVDPLLIAAAEASAELTRDWIWTRLHRWSQHGTGATGGGLGFVEI